MLLGGSILFMFDISHASGHEDMENADENEEAWAMFDNFQVQSRWFTSQLYQDAPQA